MRRLDYHHVTFTLPAVAVRARRALWQLRSAIREVCGERTVEKVSSQIEQAIPLTVYSLCLSCNI